MPLVRFHDLLYRTDTVTGNRLNIRLVYCMHTVQLAFYLYKLEYCELYDAREASVSPV